LIRDLLHTYIVDHQNEVTHLQKCCYLYVLLTKLSLHILFIDQYAVTHITHNLPNCWNTLVLLTKFLLHIWIVDQSVVTHLNCWLNYCCTLELLTKNAVIHLNCWPKFLHKWIVDQIVVAHLNCLPKCCYTLELLTRLLLHTWIIDWKCCFTLELFTKLLLLICIADQIIVTHLNYWPKMLLHTLIFTKLLLHTWIIDQSVVTHLNCWPKCWYTLELLTKLLIYTWIIDQMKIITTCFCTLGSDGVSRRVFSSCGLLCVFVPSEMMVFLEGCPANVACHVFQYPRRQWCSWERYVAACFCWLSSSCTWTSSFASRHVGASPASTSPPKRRTPRLRL